MPYFRKEALAKYVGTGCQRQLRLYLSPDNQRYQAERAAQRMPSVQPPRPGLAQIAQAGEAWGRAKVADLARAFGPAAIVGMPVAHPTDETRYRPLPLDAAVGQAAPGQFLVEAEYTIGPAFEQALGIAAHRARLWLDYAAARPDLIAV